MLKKRGSNQIETDLQNYDKSIASSIEHPGEALDQIREVEVQMLNEIKNRSKQAEAHIECMTGQNMSTESHAPDSFW